jgi:hypothetical protein
MIPLVTPTEEVTYTLAPTPIINQSKVVETDNNILLLFIVVLIISVIAFSLSLYFYNKRKRIVSLQ